MRLVGLETSHGGDRRRWSLPTERREVVNEEWPGAAPRIYLSLAVGPAKDGNRCKHAHIQDEASSDS